MNFAHARIHRSFLIVLAAFALVVAAPISAQNSSSEHNGLPDDWTHHHAVFADAGTAEQAIQNGTYDQWLKVVDDPRYQLQQAKRNVAARAKTTNVDTGNLGVDGDAGMDDAPTTDTYGAPSEPLRLPRGLTRAIVPPKSTGAGRILNSAAGRCIRH